MTVTRRMRVGELAREEVPPGTLIRVTGVATDGGHDDTGSLLGRTGTVKLLRQLSVRSLDVRWHGSSSTLSLISEDTIEIIGCPSCGLSGFDEFVDETGAMCENCGSNVFYSDLAHAQSYEAAG